MLIKNFTYLFVFAILLSCTKRDITIELTNESQIVEGNEAPPFNRITTVQLQNYINKVHIDLIGREPNQTELNQWTNTFQTEEITDELQDDFMTSLMSEPEYYDRIFEVYSGNLLSGVTKVDIEGFIDTYIFLIDLYTQQNEMLTVQVLEIELARYQNIFNATDELAVGNITFNEYLAAFLLNEIYEEINMGAENYVIGAFEGLFKRSPTEAELISGVTMVDGIPAQLLFRDGLTKSDFVEIMTTVPEFYQGLVIDIYERLLARRPDSIEMTDATILLTGGGTYQDVQRLVMRKGEYRGF